MKTIGTVTFKNFNALMVWHESLTIEERRAFAKAVKEKLKGLFPGFRSSAQRDTEAAIINSKAEYMYMVPERPKGFFSEEAEESFNNEPPPGYRGRQINVGDVVAINKEGKRSSWYRNPDGFVKLNGFDRQKWGDKDQKWRNQK